MDRVYIIPDQTEDERVLEKRLRTRRDELNKNENDQVLFFDGQSFEDRSASIRLMYSKSQMNCINSDQIRPVCPTPAVLGHQTPCLTVNKLSE